MSISGITKGIPAVKPLLQPNNQVNPQQQGGQGSFQQLFTDAIKDVNEMQLHADQQIEGLMLGKPGVNTHDAMIALEKADIAFQMMNQIRSKIVRAYQEVMRTQV